MAQGTMKDVLDYFKKDTERPVKPTEFKAFWESCSDREREYFKTAAYELMHR